MALADELRRILTIISDMTHNDTKTNVKDTQIIAEVNRPSAEVENQLKELQSLGLIEQDTNSPTTNVEYKIYKITRNGVKEVYNKEFR
jgi:predicted transcriptional regulator